MKINLQDEITRTENHEYGNYCEERQHASYWVGQLLNELSHDYKLTADTDKELESAIRTVKRMEQELFSLNYWYETLKF